MTFRDVGDFQIEDVPKPSLQAASDVLLKVTLGAICGSDLHIYHGHTPINPGAVIGHEFTGVIEEVGPEVRRFRAGDRDRLIDVQEAEHLPDRSGVVGAKVVVDQREDVLLAERLAVAPQLLGVFDAIV